MSDPLSIEYVGAIVGWAVFDRNNACLCAGLPNEQAARQAALRLICRRVADA